MQNIMLMNTVPRGLRTVAPPLMVLPSAALAMGQNQPVKAPRSMAPSMMAIKR